MNTYLTTLLKLNSANVLKTLSGLGTGLLTIAGFAEQLPGIPPSVKNIAGVIVGIATVLAAHGFHVAEPPKEAKSEKLKNKDGRTESPPHYS